MSAVKPFTVHFPADFGASRPVPSADWCQVHRFTTKCQASAACPEGFAPVKAHGRFESAWVVANGQQVASAVGPGHWAAPSEGVTFAWSWVQE